MPRFRPDIVGLSPYVPGRAIEDVAVEIGIPPSEILKLASNESPDGPFPGVVEAVTATLAESNRYPDNDNTALKSVLAESLGVPGEALWLGNGSVALLGHVALAVGGPGTSAVYGRPSFDMYRIVTRWAMSEPVEVPLDDDQVYDLGAIGDAIRPDTTVVYVCNPNNPTGTVVPGDSLRSFVESVPESVLVVVDEAYHEFVTDDDYSSMLHLAPARPNLIVLRTFSKVYALAAHRVGYGVSHPGTITELRKAQAPFSVSQVAQAAAVASLADRGELERRVRRNDEQRRYVMAALSDRGLPHTRSQANFVYFRTPLTSGRAADAFTRAGVIVRPMAAGWLRVTLGSESDNRRLIGALDQVLASR